MCRCEIDYKLQYALFGFWYRLIWDDDVYVHYQVPVGHPAEVDEIFDAISYSKGASVIRMLHSWIGDDVSVYYI